MIRGLLNSCYVLTRAKSSRKHSTSRKHRKAWKRSSEENINALTEIICRAGSDSSAALLVLMATLENSTHPRLLANAAKHVAFTRCGDLNLYRLVGAHIPQIDDEMCAD